MLIRPCLSLLAVLFLSHTAFAQTRLTFTKSQMYEDADSLIATIHTVSPHLPIKKDLWHYDAMAAMKAQRAKIDTVSSDFSFFLVLQSILHLAQDMHTSLIGQENEWANAQYQTYRKLRNTYKLSVGNVYINGKYYTIDPFVIRKDTFPIGTVITHVNGQKVDQYLKDRLGTTHGITYDLKHKKFYYAGFLKNTETILADSVEIGLKPPKGKAVRHKVATHTFTKYLPSSRYQDTTRVELWEKERLLYIRLTDMEPEFKPFLEAKLKEIKGHLKDIDKIVIDIRDNPGGQDNVWQDLFADIIDQPITYPLKIDDYQNSVMTTEKLASHGFEKVSIEKDNHPLLRKYNFYNLVDTTETLAPSEESLHFKGKVYLLAEKHYSSAGSAVAVACANPHDQLVAVGRETGYFLGIGFSPQKFVLPHSQLAYRIAPSIEVTNVRTLKDLMHDRMEIKVPHDLRYYQAVFDYKGQPTEKAFMLQHDPFIRMVMGQ